MLRLEQLSVQYGVLKAVNKVSLSIAPATINVIEGHHGAGKSSLLQAIIGAVPAQGKVWLDQRLLNNRRSPAQLLRMGVVLVPEGRQVFARLSTRENLQFGLHVSGQKGSISEVLEYFPELAPLLDQPAYVLSGGQAQMLAMARALLSKPSYLLADEPWLGLSYGPRDRVWQVLTDLCSKGVGILVSGEHKVPTGAAIKQRKIMHNGNFELGE
ncbi:MAG: ATP-binding cassette domain-containing protein [Gammaproteobacteria bacterium]|jgi:branched-chain amino acid transport system ATP-binding protein|nr:ATP-binding cassette domain-containing protein [Gammaproteobacteria bacterium]